jgi:hypothetical protein
MLRKFQTQKPPRLRADLPGAIHRPNRTLGEPSGRHARTRQERLKSAAMKRPVSFGKKAPMARKIGRIGIVAPVLPWIFKKFGASFPKDPCFFGFQISFA